MSFVGSKEFADLTRQLADRIEDVAKVLGSHHGGSDLPSSSLSQMSMPLGQLSQELLMFGADVWPLAADDKVVYFPARRVNLTLPNETLVAPLYAGVPPHLLWPARVMQLMIAAAIGAMLFALFAHGSSAHAKTPYDATIGCAGAPDPEALQTSEI
jgi:hypothetical protein